MNDDGMLHCTPEFSVVIPARDESAVIARCLRAATATLRPEEAEIIVVCNGCTDDTAEIARSFAPLVRVLETSIASKSKALNLGDSLATKFPRIYLDADIEVESEVLRALASLLSGDSAVLAASPRGIVCLDDRGLAVRSFYTVWTALPYFQEGPFGSGLFAFSHEGRRRFGQFPNIIADDGFARLAVEPHERSVLESGTFKIFPPTTISGVLKINVRARAGLHQLRKQCPGLDRHESSSPAHSLLAVARRPRLWPHAPFYFGVMLIAGLAARYKLWMGREEVWERDSTSRESSLES